MIKIAKARTHLRTEFLPAPNYLMRITRYQQLYFLSIIVIFL